MSKPTQPLTRGKLSWKSVLKHGGNKVATPDVTLTTKVASPPKPGEECLPPPPSVSERTQPHAPTTGKSWKTFFNRKRSNTGPPMTRVPNSNSYSYPYGFRSTSDMSSFALGDKDDPDDDPVLRSTHAVISAEPSSAEFERSDLLPNRNPSWSRRKLAAPMHQMDLRAPRDVAPISNVPPQFKDLPPTPLPPLLKHDRSRSNLSVLASRNGHGDCSILMEQASNNTSGKGTQPSPVPSLPQKPRSRGAAASLAHPDFSTTASSSAVNHTLPVKSAEKVDSPSEHVYCLSLDLEQLPRGGQYKFQITRHMLNGKKKDETMLVDVQPGCKSGTRITFPGAGDERAPGQYQDVIIVVKQVHHESCAHLDNGHEGTVQTPSNSVENTQVSQFSDSPAHSTVKFRQPQQQPLIREWTVEHESQQQHQQFDHLNAALVGLGRHRIPLGCLEIDESSVIGKGGFGVVLRGKMTGYHSAVAVKRLMSDETRDIRVSKRLLREMKLWSKLDHPGILPLLGFHLSVQLDIALIVCPLQPHGNVRDYLKQVNPTDAVRLGLSFDTLFAVKYLHGLDPPVVHGDIKALNILMTDERRAVLCDFGLALAADEDPTGLTTSKGLQGTVRYCSPELVMQAGARRSVRSDMWAWGCLLVEIMKETVPYSNLKNDIQVILALAKGVCPESRELLTHPINIWSIVQGCWQVHPELRSTAEMSMKDFRLLTNSLDTVTKNVLDSSVFTET